VVPKTRLRLEKLGFFVEDTDIIHLLLAVGGLAGFQAFATWRAWHTDAYERPQKVAQTRLIWFLPLIGAVLVLMMLREADRAGRA
jgi:hypothetical protein